MISLRSNCNSRGVNVTSFVLIDGTSNETKNQNRIWGSLRSSNHSALALGTPKLHNEGFFNNEAHYDLNSVSVSSAGLGSCRLRRPMRDQGSLRRAQGLGTHTPLPHAAHSLSLECPSQRNRHPSPRLAAERAREALKSVVCFRRAGVRKRRGELASNATWLRHPAEPG